LRLHYEKQLFGELYYSKNNLRPKYGCISSSVSGKAVNSIYGSDYLLLNQKTKERCTWISGDSAVWNDKKIECPATFKYCAHVLLGLSSEELISLSNVVQGQRDPKFLNFRDYKEVQIHGELLLSRDVECLFINNENTLSSEAREAVLNFSKKKQLPIILKKTRFRGRKSLK